MYAATFFHAIFSKPLLDRSLSEMSELAPEQALTPSRKSSICSRRQGLAVSEEFRFSSTHIYECPLGLPQPLLFTLGQSAIPPAQGRFCFFELSQNLDLFVGKSLAFV